MIPKNDACIVPVQTPTALVVLLHGYGASGEDLLPLARAFSEVLPSVAFWMPNGPERLSAGGCAGYQWFPLTEEDFDNRIPLESLISRLEYATQAVCARLQQSSAELPIVIGGFSQGAALAFHVGLYGVPTLGVLGYSGFFEPLLKRSPAFSPPLFWCHGALDEVVPPSAMQRMHVMFPAMETHLIPSVAHHISPEGASLGMRFLKKILVPGETLL